MTTPKTIAILFHSNYGHTRRVAYAIQDGVLKLSPKVFCQIFDVQKLMEDDWQYLDSADMLVFGSAVYLGGVTADFKKFMDSKGHMVAQA